jgi:hypothetical protein
MTTDDRARPPAPPFIRGAALSPTVSASPSRTAAASSASSARAGAGYLFHNSNPGQESQVHTNALNGFVNDGSWSFQRNVVGGIDPQFAPLNPSTSWYPATVAGVGFAADWSLALTSPFKGKAWNGTDPGANVGEVLRLTAGVVVAP